MKRAPLILAIGAGLALAGAARAEPTLDLFQKFCVAHHADRAKALAAADAEGSWTPFPPAMLAMLPESARGVDPDGRMKVESGGAIFLIVGRADTLPTGQKIAVALCVVGAAPGDSAALKAAAAGFAAVPPAPAGNVKDADIYVWRGLGARHVAIPPGESLTVSPDTSVLIVSGNAQTAMVGLVVPTK